MALTTIGISSSEYPLGVYDIIQLMTFLGVRRTKRLESWASRLFVFLPWSLFWSNHASLLTDQSKIHLGFSATSDCSQTRGTSWATVAHSEDAKRKGLSGRHQPLRQEESMLFIYDQSKSLAFWM